MAITRGKWSIRKMLIMLFIINTGVLFMFRFYTRKHRDENVVTRNILQFYNNTGGVVPENFSGPIVNTNGLRTTLPAAAEATNVNKQDDSTLTSPSPNCVEYDLNGMISVDFKLCLRVFHNLSKIGDEDIKAHGELYLGSSRDGIQYQLSKNVQVFEPQNTTCQVTQNVAFIIPFRNRESHLRLVLGHLIPILQKQNIRFAFFVVTQNGDEHFNKGRLMNTGFEFASEVGKARNQPFDCFIFHDVDLFVEHDTLLHRCTGGEQIDHFAPRIDKFKYVPYCCGMTVGGVIGFTEEQYRKVNGYSNKFWGWGAEDDDMFDRLTFHNLTINRPEGDLGKYKMLYHNRDKLNPINKGRFKILWDKNKQYSNDGIESLETSITSVVRYPLFVNVLVDVGKPPM